MPIAMPFDDGGTAVLVPTFGPDGASLDETAAIAQYKSTGKHFGKFDTPDNARAYAEQLTQQYAQPPVATPADNVSVPAGRRRVGSVVPPVAPPAAAPEPAVSGPPPLPSLEQHLAGVSKINPFTGQPATPSQLDAAIALARADHGRMMAATEESRARLKNTLANGAASLADGRPFTWNDAEIRSLIPQPDADKVIGVMRDSEKAGQFIGSIRISSPAANEQHRAELLAGLSDPQAPDYEHRKKLLNIYETKLLEQQKERDEDAAMYAYKYIPGVAEKLQTAFIEQTRPSPPGATAINPKIAETWDNYVQSTKAVQRYLGVPEDKQRILPVKMAAEEAKKIAALDPTTTKPAQYMAALAAKYGAGQGAYDHWPQVFGELVKAKLPGEYQVLASMDRPDQAAAADALSRAMGEVAKKGGMAVLKQNAGEEGKKIEKELATQLQQFRLSTGTQTGGQELYDRVHDAAHALALHYAYNSTKDGSTAAKEAVDGIINRKYDFVEMGDLTVRVPKGMGSVVSDAADRIKADLRPEDLPPIPGHPLLKPAERQAMWMEAIRRGGWATNNDESGIVLMGKFRDGAPVAIHRNDGSLVVLPFRDAAAYAEGPGPGDLPPRRAIAQPQEGETAPAGPRLPGGFRSPAPTGTALPPGPR
jgi:soluble lytic murein transglycosylase